MEIAIFFFFWFVFAIVVGVAANARGRDGGGWFFLALIISPLARLIRQRAPERLASVV
jgi:hypothetical protein